MWKLCLTLLLACDFVLPGQSRSDDDRSFQTPEEELAFVLLSLSPGSASKQVREKVARSRPIVASASRRDVLRGLGSAAGAAAIAGLPESVSASGGATAGKTTTIPVAKRRYYGRVKQGVVTWILMRDAINAGDLKSQYIADFFAGIVYKNEKKGTMFNPRKDKRTELSQWEDLQITVPLLGNAFRYDGGTPPMRVKGYVLGTKWLKDVEALKKQLEKNDEDVDTAKALLAKASEDLDPFLDEVDLPPLTEPNAFEFYRDADKGVKSLCQGSFCL
jgi:hypothetical protein